MVHPCTETIDGVNSITERPEDSTRDHILDQWFALVANRRCRRTLTILRQLPDETVTLVELTHHLSNATDEPVDVTSERDRMRLRSELHHSLLPKLAAASVVTYSTERTVRYSPSPEFESLFAQLPIDSDQGTTDSTSSSNMDTHETVLVGLANSRRRLALNRLRTCGSMALADLADEVAVHEHGHPLTEISPEVVLRCYTSLYHTHIPSLEAALLVQYDQPTDWVNLKEHATALERYEEYLSPDFNRYH